MWRQYVFCLLWLGGQAIDALRVVWAIHCQALWCSSLGLCRPPALRLDTCWIGSVFLRTRPPASIPPSSQGGTCATAATTVAPLVRPSCCLHHQHPHAYIVRSDGWVPLASQSSVGRLHAGARDSRRRRPCLPSPAPPPLRIAAPSAPNRSTACRRRRYPSGQRRLSPPIRTLRPHPLASVRWYRWHMCALPCA